MLGNVTAAGDCSVWALLIGFACGFGDVEVGDETLRDDVLDVLTGGWPVGLLAPLTGSAGVLVVVGADLDPTDAGDSGLGNTGKLVRAGPVLCTMPVRGSGVVDDDELPVAGDDVDEGIVDDGEFAPACEVDADELVKLLDGPLLLVDEEAGEEDELEDDELDDEPDDELEPDGSANATPGIVATADPTPSATANAPTRPT